MKNKATPIDFADNKQLIYTKQDYSPNLTNNQENKTATNEKISNLIWPIYPMIYQIFCTIT